MFLHTCIIEYCTMSFLHMEIPNNIFKVLFNLALIFATKLSVVQFSLPTLQLCSMAKTVKKVVILGDAGCGKSSLMDVFTTNKELEEDTLITIENRIVPFKFKGKEISLSLWSASGEKS